jgi:hypothetical protein
MAFQVSPGVNVSEIDLSTVVPATSTTEGAIAGVFRWGPTNERVLVSSEVDLVRRFGKPVVNFNEETFYSAADFLAYSDALYVVRVSDGNTATGAANSALEDISAKYPGEIGSSIGVQIIDATQWAQNDLGFDYAPEANNFHIIVTDDVDGTISGVKSTQTNVETETLAYTGWSEDANTGVVTVTLDTDEEDKVAEGDWYVSITGTKEDLPDASTGTITLPSGNPIIGQLAEANSAPTSGSLSVALDIPVVTVLETFENVSLVEGSRDVNGNNNYLVDVLENRSAWIKVSDTTTVANTIASMAVGQTLTGGTDGSSEDDIAMGDVMVGYDLFKSPEDVDVSLLIQGKGRGTSATGYTALSNYITDIATSRKDCVACLSPARELVVNITDTNTILENLTGSTAASVGTSATRSTYAIWDTGYKYRYDKYNDRYIYTPLNGDIAGLCVRTDDQRDPWFSPAGYQRGQVKNIIKLSYNPVLAHRDALYKKGFNPVVTQPGQGTVLFGDKTYASIASAFDRINVRRLFIVLEKAIANASKAMLFEFNDEFTRAQFRNMVEPFLRDVQGRRGIYDFRVVCDDTNNTPEVIDTNRFVGDIYIKPARSINFIQLNFVAVRTGVEFSEIVGQ